jgi:hypothetical protein
VLDGIAALLGQPHVHGVGVAEQVVQVAEDLLIGADQEHADVVRLAVPGVQLEHFFHVALVDELVDPCRSLSQVEVRRRPPRRTGFSSSRWMACPGRVASTPWSGAD